MKQETLKSGELFTWSGSAKVIFENAVFVLPPPAAVTCDFKRACTQSLSCVNIWTTLISENTGLTCSASMTLLAEFPWPCPSFAGQENVYVAWLTPDALCHLTIRITCAFICVPCSPKERDQKYDLLLLLLVLYSILSVCIFSPASRAMCNVWAMLMFNFLLFCKSCWKVKV